MNESEIIAVGTILSAEAHLSESKRNVFSEFTLSVENVLKSTVPGLVPGSVLTIDRVGGHVRYPNGQRVRFRIGGLNMPHVGARYLFFLTSKHNKQDLSIVTAYELTQGDIFLSMRFLHFVISRALPNQSFSKKYVS